MIKLNKPSNLKKFCSFLIENGAKVLDPTNPWEVLRYRLEGYGTVVVYKKASGALNIPSTALEHLNCFEKGRAISRKDRPGKNHKTEIISRIIDRDGDDCCICGQPLGGDITLEHWIPIRDGGNNMMANLGLAHEACNQAVGSKSISEKIEISIKMRLASKSQNQPE